MTEAVILGRQPETLWITPSKPNPWYGSITEGDALTVQQRDYLAKRQLDRAPLTITVKRNATHREAWWPRGSVPPQYHFECPVLGRNGDGSVTIVAPAGFAQTVRADGWVGEPGKIKRSL
jgi:hypothetical protein